MKRNGFNLLKLTYLTTPLLFFSLGASAQIDMGNVREGESVEFCKTHKVFAENMKDPAFASEYYKSQTEMKKVEEQMKANPNPTRQIYYIPIVFHVIHEGGSENISAEQIQSAVNILNRDYSLQNADAADVQYEFNASNPSHVAQPADVGVQFRLATKAPNGTYFSGITRTYSSASSASGNNSGQQQVAAVKNGNDVYKGEWPGNKYLNVYVVKSAGGAAGYTMTPMGTFTSMSNGIYILYNYVGDTLTGNIQLSRALTHEVGHWLNLQHTWGPNNNPGNMSSCSTDDDVDDTPNTIGVTSCKLNENSCGEKANVENYMDYSYCSKMFTEGQAARMIAALNSTTGGRNNVWKSSNLQATGADGNLALQAAKFSSSNQLVCAGAPVTFNDESINVVTSRTWTFQGGTPATSTDKNPKITYNTPGVYEVSLTVSDGTKTLTETKSTYIKVIGDATIPYFEGFENYTNTDEITNALIVNPNASSRPWEITTKAAKTGNQSLYINNFKETSGNIDDFVSPNFDLSGTDKVTLSFRYAVAKKSNSQDSEFLKVYASNDCGESYNLRKTITGNSLTKTVSSSDWVPTKEDWVTQHITNITSAYLVKNFKFKISYESKGGNNVYLDDINLYSGSSSNDIVLGMNDVTNNITGIQIYPNPTSDILNVNYNVTSAENNLIEVIDLVGKVVKSFNINSNTGLNNVIINTDDLQNGSYFVRVGNQVNSSTLQFIKQ